MNNQTELAEGLAYLVKWDDYDGLAAVRESNTKQALLAAAELLKPLEKKLLFSMVKNANNDTISAFETIPEKRMVKSDPKALEFVVGNTYLIDGLKITISSIGTHGVTGNGFVRLFTRIKTIELVKELAIV